MRKQTARKVREYSRLYWQAATYQKPEEKKSFWRRLFDSVAGFARRLFGKKKPEDLGPLLKRKYGHYERFYQAMKIKWTTTPWNKRNILKLFFE